MTPENNQTGQPEDAKPTPKRRRRLRVTARNVPYRFVPIPWSIIEIWLPTLTGHEFKVYAYIAAKTYGDHLQRDAALPLTDISRATGLSRWSVIRALQTLTDKALLRVTGPPHSLKHYEIFMTSPLPRCSTHATLAPKKRPPM